MTKVTFPWFSVSVVDQGLMEWDNDEDFEVESILDHVIDEVQLRLLNACSDCCLCFS